MVDTVELAARLRQTAQRIETWQAQAAQLQGLVEAAQIAGTVSESLLQSIEETAGTIYAEIAAYDGLVETVAEQSPEAAGQLAEVGEALHLVLMEITELGTQMYAVRSP